MRTNKRLYHVLHDWSHVLMAATAHAGWTERLHDWVGVRWEVRDSSQAIVVRGQEPKLGAAVDALVGAGFTTRSRMHDVAVLEETE